MKYNKNFERDFNWYLSMRHIFNFDGAIGYFKKSVAIRIYKGDELVSEKVMSETSYNKYEIVEEEGMKYYVASKAEKVIQFDRKGVNGKEAFFQWDSNGVIKATKHPNLLHCLLKTKGSTNLHIKMYAEDRAACNWGFIEFRALCIKFKAPLWFREAVENQKVKYYE